MENDEQKKWIHDIRGKLASILLYIELIEKNYNMKTDKNHDLIVNLRTSVKDMAELIENKQ